jgi:hypothetical protein
LLPWSPQETAAFICNNFQDANGNALSELTVRTILTPSREDKRCDVGKRIKLNSK